MSATETAQGDDAERPALERCLLHLAASLERPLTEAALDDARTGAGALSVRDVITVAGRAGLQAGFGARKLAAFDAALCPALLFLNDDRAVVLHGRRSETCLVHDPDLGEGIGEVARAALEAQYTGYALLFRKEHREDIAASAAQGGHWFWSALAANRWAYVQVLLAAVLTNILALVTSIFTMVVYDRILPNEATESLIALTAGVGLALVFDFILKGLRAGFIDRAGQRADLVMGRRLFDQLLDVQMAAKKGSSGALANTLREFETLRDFITSATLVAVVDLPFVLMFIFVIHAIGGPLAWVPGVAVPIAIAVGLIVQPLLARLAERSFQDGQSKQSVLVETVSGLETIKATGAGRAMRARWEEASLRQSDHAVRSRALTQFALNATGFVQQSAQVLIVFYGVFLIADGVTSMGALIAAVILTGRCLAPLAQLVQTLTRFNGAQQAYRSLNALMDAASERPEGHAWISRPTLTGKIQFEDVRFAYPEAGTEALKGVSFTINPGEKVAILGRIGSGKSTVARLMIGLYVPQQGSVRMDGVDLRQIDPGDLRRNVGSVLQDVWLFTGTVRDNIAIGAVRPRDGAILDAAKIAGVEDFVSRHPSGYDLMLAERGEGLSGGQRQAIALARALVGRPPILLMDEPTSAMDVQTEATVIGRLKADLGPRTMVIVTHRTALLELVDRVIVIDDGRVAFDGDKAQMLRAGQSAAPPAGRGGVS